LGPPFKKLDGAIMQVAQLRQELSKVTHAERAVVCR
jgi:hypothetical protein